MTDLHDAFRRAVAGGKPALRDFIRERVDDDRSLSLVRQALEQLIRLVADRRRAGL